MAIFYYGLAVVGTAAAVLVVCNLAIKKWCGGATVDEEQGTRRSFEEEASTRSHNRHKDSSRYLLHSFRYKKSEEVKDVGESECVVCLSAFEDDEVVKRLNGCDHSFHAACIDMWLCSHTDCPLCRAYVAEQPLTAAESSPEPV